MYFSLSVKRIGSVTNVNKLLEAAFEKVIQEGKWVLTQGMKRKLKSWESPGSTQLEKQTVSHLQLVKREILWATKPNWDSD